MNNEMQTRQQQAPANFALNRVAKQFSDTVSSQIGQVTNLISGPEAARLTMALCVAANDGLTAGNKKYSWSQVNANRFVMDAIRVATLGLDAGQNEVYVVPYAEGKNGCYLDCTMSVWGWRKLVMQYHVGRKIVDFKHFVIREGDRFSVRHTPTDDIWEYEENCFGTGKPIGYVTIACYEDGCSNVMTHSLEDIEKRRKASRSPNSPAWTKWPEEMAIAKAIRRHCKVLPFKLPDERNKAISELEDPEARATAEREANANKEMIDITPSEDFKALPEGEAVADELEPVNDDVAEDPETEAEMYDEMAAQYDAMPDF